MDEQLTEVVQTQPPALPTPQGVSAFDMMSHLISQGADLDKIEKAMELQAKWEEAQARKAYFSAMAAFKTNPPEIVKSQSVDYTTAKGRTSYKHADLGEACEVINTGFAEHGLSSSWSLEQGEDKVCVTCTVTHALGYSQSVTLCGPLDTSGNKEALKALGSTITYLERYTLFAISGTAPKNQDREAPPVKNIDKQQLSELLDIADSRKVNKKGFLKQLGIASFEEIPAEWFTQARADLMGLGVDP